MIVAIKDHATARKLAVRAADDGLVVGLWATLFDNYCVSVYCRRIAVDQTELGCLIEAADVDAVISDIYCGGVRILEMGYAPLAYPMFGAWNWGTTLPDPIPCAIPGHME